MPRKLTTEEFIAKAKAVHGDKYNYDKVIYKGKSDDVIITCHKHGDFPQKPYRHLQGRGCHECAKKKISETLRMAVHEFITKAKEKHGDKYDYSFVEINGNNKTKVKIKCNKCGVIFEQRIDSHLDGRGCPHCVKEEKTKTIEEFISDARAVHGDKYNYAKVKYISAFKRVIITCPKHGDFSMTPNNHTSKGEGCPYCNQSHLEEQTRILLNKNKITFEPQMKFTWLMSSKNYPMRLDFYLLDYNVAIECQGEQHYMEEPRWVFTEGELRDIKQRDTIKYNLCKEHGIPIFYIKYDENIENKIAKIINEIKKQQ